LLTREEAIARATAAQDMKAATAKRATGRPVRQKRTHDALGVEPTASDEEIRTAFRGLTRDLHPDRFSGEERARAEQRFQEITEAFNALRNPESRQRYDRELGQGEPTKAMDPAEIARRLDAKGAQAFREGRLTEALENLQMAINHDESCARAHFFLASTLAKLPGRLRDALRHMERATQLEALNASIKAEAAQMFLAAGMATRARRLAQEALSLDPTSQKASDVLVKTDIHEAEPATDGLLRSTAAKETSIGW
jgi:tetratricopeptide (TPR) repeat protein